MHQPSYVHALLLASVILSALFVCSLVLRLTRPTMQGSRCPVSRLVYSEASAS
jgi:hypothetical protein